MTAVAVVTGAASGIGLAIATALHARGDRVVLADLDAAGARAAAGRLGGPATAEPLDVRDAGAVAALVSGTVERFGRLDVMVNNAGLGVAGEALELGLPYWDRILDVNLRGVVHGVAAAYPVMVRQGRGHIVNVASLAGLVPAPMLVPYSTSKYAVVGLSLALRPEAAGYGVRVTAVCPGFVDTPIIDKAAPEDLPRTPVGERGRELVRWAGPLYPPEALARDVLRGMDRNRAMVVTPGRARLAWWVQRLAPPVVERVNRRVVARVRRRVGDARPRAVTPGGGAG